MKSKNLKEKHIPILSKHIYKELPIRIANRVTDLNNLQFGLSKNHSINRIREWYLISFLELIEEKEPNTEKEYENFRNIIEKIYIRHAPTLLTMSKGILELKKESKISDIEAPTIQTFLNRFYTNRTEIRILLEHYLSLFDHNNNNFQNNNKDKNLKKKYYGIVNLRTNPYDIINNVIILSIVLS